MKVFSLLGLFLLSCAYPDIDSTPEFNNLIITEKESIDLCKMTNTIDKDILACISEYYESQK